MFPLFAPTIITIVILFLGTLIILILSKEHDTERTRIRISGFSTLIVLCIGIFSAYIAFQANENSENVLEISQRMKEIEEERLRLLTFSTAKIKSNDFKIDKINNEPKGGGEIVISNIGVYKITGLRTYIYYIGTEEGRDRKEDLIFKFFKEDIASTLPTFSLKEELRISNKDHFIKRDFLERIEEKQEYQDYLSDFIKNENIKIFEASYGGGRIDSLEVKDRFKIYIGELWSSEGGDDSFFICIKIEWDEGEDYAIYYFERP